MTTWLRFRAEGKTGFGMLDGDVIAVHDGCMFEGARPTGARIPLSAVTLEAPCTPSKIIALWNNFHELAAKLNVAEPAEPLYLLKAPSSAAPPDARVRPPQGYGGKTVFEGELGIVIGRRASHLDEAEAAAHIFGYTVVNDLTAADELSRDPTFPQWARAKGHDGYGPFGPWIETAFDPAAARVRTVLNGAVRQDYPLNDMVFAPQRLIALLSRDMTLLPGDLICCGTSVGVGAMRAPSNLVEVSIDGIGTLRTVFEP